MLISQRWSAEPRRCCAQPQQYSMPASALLVCYDRASAQPAPVPLFNCSRLLLFAIALPFMCVCARCSVLSFCMPLQAQYAMPTSWLRRIIFKVAMSQYCEFFIMVVIVANVVFLTLTHANMDDKWQSVLSWSNVVFTAIFTFEALLKMVAIGLWNYLKDGWSQFDLFVVSVSIVGVAIDMGTTQNLDFLPLIRVMRVARVFRLIPKAQGLR
eukprot:GHUV01035311.1.p1 GENE.GHUV01035311.1~~GHUV01035311.1.p1  ORF type:complete len:212 (+),score=29.33 GHUV01035311.1:258-893(+)